MFINLYRISMWGHDGCRHLYHPKKEKGKVTEVPGSNFGMSFLNLVLCNLLNSMVNAQMRHLHC